MSFGKDFRKGLLGNDYFRDFQHASRVFATDTLALAPRLKFLYHTVFTLNTAAIPILRTLFPVSVASQISLMAKTVQLPGFDIATEQLKQYNRTRIVQTGIQYQPITITLHDDGQDLIRSLWRQYYRYHYGDSVARKDQYGQRSIYDNELVDYNWGLSGEPYQALSPGVKAPFFTDITVYSLNQKTNVGYKLVNPIIKSWQHDTYDYAAGGETMEHTVTVEYEYVEYLNSTTQPPPGFANPANYDTAPSPLGQAGATASILGQGGLLDSAGNILTDIAEGNLLGALLGTARVIENRKQYTAAGVREEAQQVARSAINTVRTQGGFPIPPRL